MHTSKDWRHEEKHKENLRLKLKRELPEEILEDCETFGQLEAKKHLVECFKHDVPCRSTEERKALQYEEAASGLDLEE